jgi:hypothetical protein
MPASGPTLPRMPAKHLEPRHLVDRVAMGVAIEELGDSARDGLRALDLQQVTDTLHGQVLELRQPRAQQGRAVDEQLLALGAQHRQDRLSASTSSIASTERGLPPPRTRRPLWARSKRRRPPCAAP